MHKLTVFDCNGDIVKELVFSSEDFVSDYMKMLIEDLDKLKYWVDFKKVEDKYIIKVEHQVIIVGD
ncbi:MAG: hypothetical protein L7G90_03255 [Candidatus Nanopusillus sp.]|jgi:hypothetical protein|nr:hypothetical protein [Candidatus Nanopusillus sp.]